MHPRIPLAFLAARAHYWLMVNLSSTRTPRSLSAEYANSRVIYFLPENEIITWKS